MCEKKTAERLRSTSQQLAANKEYTEKLEEEVRTKQARLSTASENETRLNLKIKHIQDLHAETESQMKKEVERLEAQVGVQGLDAVLMLACWKEVLEGGVGRRWSDSRRR